MNKSILRLLAIILVMCPASNLTGCSQPNDQRKVTADYTETQAQAMQKRGLMSSNDFTELAKLSGVAASRRSLSDADFAHLMTLMKAHQGVIKYSPSRSVVATHITAMSILRSMDRATPTQRQQVITAVSPLLISQNKYERSIAKQVTNKFSNNEH